MQAKVADRKAKLRVREARPPDIPAIVDLARRVYAPAWSYSEGMIRGQLAQFPEGQFVAEYDGRIVGYCATFRAREALVMGPHTWMEITGGGYASRHSQGGDWLYGMEVCVDNAHRGLRIGQRLYDRRKKLCMELGLKGIVFGGRLPGFARRRAKVESALDYAEHVRNGRMRDSTLNFQLRNGFELLGVLEGYEPSDLESLGYAAHLVWRNPNASDNPVIASAQRSGQIKDWVRMASVQYQQRRVATFEEFATQVEYFVDVAADYRSDFVVFPELFTLQLLSIANQKLEPAESIATLTGYTERVRNLLSGLAVRYNINIIGGSHPTRMDDGDIHNVCYVCLRDGAVYTQEKLHPTPNERRWWNIVGGDDAVAIPTDCGPIGVMICYDAEFPELARHLIDQGALILFVPFCTDERQSYLRVRYSCQARAVENQCYMVLSGNVGNMPGVHNFDIQYAQSCILTPCDFPFARDGIAADTTPNVEAVALADLRLDSLIAARNTGTVQNLKDRRHDLYQTRWQSRPARQLRLKNPEED
jgi:predicted amidohydrolase/ribosomal protein S18 acetylase RimI-like enzyme